MLLYDNAFSPFARKVRLVLDHKHLTYDTIDGLTRKARDTLEQVNGRIEVPVLDDDGVVVVGSADIVAYLERWYPERPLYPRSRGDAVRARAWERCADTVIDPILIDISYWNWAKRPDHMPDGMLEAARADLAQIYDELERELGDRAFVCGELSIADLALFPHLAAVRSLDVAFDPKRCPRLTAWYKRMREREDCARDLERARAYLANPSALDIERDKIFWRGDRIEWILARGFHAWFVREIDEGRVLWPGLGIPKA